jgi:hypothetical protein
MTGFPIRLPIESPLLYQLSYGPITPGAPSPGWFDAQPASGR